MSFSTDPVESIIQFDTLVATDRMCFIETIVNQMIEMSKTIQTVKYMVQRSRTLRQDLPTTAKAIKTLLEDFKYQMRDLGIYGASIGILAVIVEFELAKRQCETLSERNMLDAMITKADLIRHILTRLMDCEASEYNKLMLFGSRKLKCLVNYLQVHIANHSHQEFKCLVFVQRRHSAKVLYHILKRVFQELHDCEPNESGEPDIRPDFMVGRGGELPESIEAILCEKNNRRVLERFKKNETNLLCTSSVLEEGIDIQSCNLVIRYDLAQTFSAYAQSKGRARMKDSKFVIMVDKADAMKYFKKLQGYKAIEQKLKEYLVGKTINRKPPLDEEIEKELYNEMIPPFVTRGGATLTALSSLQLLNRYAMQVR